MPPMKRVVCVVALLSVACGTSVQPSDAGSLPDGVVADSSLPVDVEIVEPTSLVRVTRVPGSATIPADTVVWAWLARPNAESPLLIDRDLGECFYRRRFPTELPRYHNDGMATWGYRNVLRPLTLPDPTWPLVDSVAENLPNTGDGVNVSVRGSSFPDFSLSAAMPSELRVTSHTTDSTIAYPRRGEPLVVEWAVPTVPASVRISIGWGDNDEILYCIVPATRGRFVMEEPLQEMFRDATRAQLIVSHAAVQRVLVGNRSLRFMVERRGILATFAR
jgi:hypothetical protein